MKDTSENVGGFTLLPCAKNVCQECAVDHDRAMPHNAQSLYYQYKFYAEKGRFPTWTDALAHCAPEMRAVWKRELATKGVKVE